MKKIIVVFLAIVHFIIVGCGSCNVENKKNVNEVNIMKKAALSSKPLPMGAIKAQIDNIKFGNDNTFSATLNKIIKRGNGAPVIGNGKKVTVKYSDKQKEMVDNIQNNSIIILRFETHINNWKLISLDNN